MKDLGYLEGQNVVIESRFADGLTDRLPALAKELVGLQPDVLVIGITGLAAALQATATIPIVVPNLRAGQTAVKNPARPEANVTGIVSPSDGGIGVREQLALAKEVIPGAARIGYMLVVRRADAGVAVRQQVEAAASALGVRVVFGEFKSPEDIEAAFRAVARERVDALIVPNGTVINATRNRVMAITGAERLVTICGNYSYVLAGGLVSISGDPGGPDFRRAATYVDKILKGAKVAEVPVEQLTPKPYLAINLKTAKDLGLTLPASLLARADEKIG
jgi:putative ABC transport system substrate-binding protein